MKKMVIFLIPLIVLQGCSRPPQIQYYDLELKLSRSERLSDLPLIIQPFEAGPMLDQECLLYKASVYELRRDPYRRWTQSPSRLLTDQARRYFKESGRMEVLSRLPVDRRAFELKGSVYHFEEIAIRGQGRIVRVAVWFELYDAAAKKIVLSKMIEKNAPISGSGAESIVAASAAAAQAVFDELAGEMKKQFASNSQAD